MGTFTTSTTETSDGQCELVVTAPDGTEMYRAVEHDEAAAKEAASTWKDANLQSCCINGDKTMVSEALNNWGLGPGRFEIVERPDASCFVRGPEKAIQGLLTECRAHLCP